MSLTLHPVGVPSFEASTCTSVIWSALIHKSPSFRNCGMVHLVFRPWLGRSLAAASWGSAGAAAGIVANVWADRAVPPQLVDEGQARCGRGLLLHIHPLLSQVSRAMACKALAIRRPAPTLP